MHRPHPMIEEDKKHIENYYRWNAGIYDATRWAILLGRNSFKDELIDQLSEHRKKRDRLTVAEIGCGTGFYLKPLAAQFPEITFMGIDTSSHMLKKAKKSLRLLANTYLLKYFFSEETKQTQFVPQDHIICSYAISMNSKPIELINQIHHSLSKDGQLHLLDFYDSRFSFIRKWMGLHGVYFYDTINELVAPYFEIKDLSIHNGYSGLFRYYKLHLKKLP